MAVQTPSPSIEPSPGVDAGVIEDARARQRRHRSVGAVLVAAIAAGIVIVSTFGGGGGGARPRTDRRGGSPSPVSSSGSFSRPVVLLRKLRNPSVYAADGRLWVIQEQNRLAAVTNVSEITRVDPRTGRVLAVRNLGATIYDQALLSNGVLWVTATVGHNVWLWRLAPDSLSVISRSRLPGSVPGSEGWVQYVGMLAATRRWLWVGGWNTLDRISISTARVTSTIGLPGAHGIDLAASPSGGALIDVTGHTVARVQRRDPSTGRLLAESPVYQGVTKPSLGGVTGTGIWLSEATGMMGYAQRISLGTLRPTRLTGTAPGGADSRVPLIEGTNGITARVMDDVLWITEASGGSELNYCGDPATGKPRVTLPLTHIPNPYYLVTASSGSVYYMLGNGRYGQLSRAAINPRC